MKFLKYTMLLYMCIPWFAVGQDYHDLLKNDSLIKKNYNTQQVITPDGNGSNDFFPNDNLLDYSKIRITIYNHLGAIVFENNDSNKIWNGRIYNSGDECPEGAYFFIFEHKKESDTEGSILRVVDTIEGNQKTSIVNSGMATLTEDDKPFLIGIINLIRMNR